MPNISDAIEDFILGALGEAVSLEISRNELANFFACAPSQINYVLETRFTLDKGFNKESRRGGGGFIKLSRINYKDDDVANLVLSKIGDELSFKRAREILTNLVTESVISNDEKRLVEAMISDASLSTPFAIKDRLRAQQFKAMLVYLITKEDGDVRK